jgi:hypothetical protein
MGLRQRYLHAMDASSFLLACMFRLAVTLPMQFLLHWLSYMTATTVNT